VIHGKHYHEETKATASQALTHPGGQYLCVRDRPEAQLVCDFIRGTLPAEALLDRLREAASPGFDPARDLQRVGLANQTTMLMTESLQIQEMVKEAVRDRWGEEALAERFRAFDTICSATQDRQDAVLKMLEEGGLAVMVVIGGYNSSNTQALARICAQRLPTYHISGADRIEGATLHHRPVGAHSETAVSGWLPEGPVTVGLTAGASTPNNVVGEVVERILALRGQKADDLIAG
jgi:4-hydroxy-3-methylbut-2-enyl diphosphate reductase